MLPGTIVTKIMCGHQLYEQGLIARPHLRPSRIYPECRVYETRLAVKDSFWARDPARKCLLHNLEKMMER